MKTNSNIKVSLYTQYLVSVPQAHTGLFYVSKRHFDTLVSLCDTLCFTVHVLGLYRSSINKVSSHDLKTYQDFINIFHD